MKTMQLSNREIEVLLLVSFENTNIEIADKLCLSYDTIKTHCKNIKLKLGVKSRAGLVRKGFEAGYL